MSFDPISKILGKKLVINKDIRISKDKQKKCKEHQDDLDRMRVADFNAGRIIRKRLDGHRFNKMKHKCSICGRMILHSKWDEENEVCFECLGAGR